MQANAQSWPHVTVIGTESGNHAKIAQDLHASHARLRQFVRTFASASEEPASINAIIGRNEVSIGERTIKIVDWSAACGMQLVTDRVLQRWNPRGEASWRAAIAAQVTERLIGGRCRALQTRSPNDAIDVETLKTLEQRYGSNGRLLTELWSFAAARNMSYWNALRIFLERHEEAPSEVIKSVIHERSLVSTRVDARLRCSDLPLHLNTESLPPWRSYVVQIDCQTGDKEDLHVWLRKEWGSEWALTVAIGSGNNYRTLHSPRAPKRAERLYAHAVRSSDEETIRIIVTNLGARWPALAGNVHAAKLIVAHQPSTSTVNGSQQSPNQAR